MWIGEIDIPEGLINAHRAGELVLFIGAGASMDPPSNLPDFRELAAEIASESRAAATSERLETPDVLLGDVEAEHDVDVHARVAARIGEPSSRPNALHGALVALAASASPARIVTTNYDLHLSTAATEQRLAFTEYMAPALPMGDDFTGLVYLHGCLRQEPRHLVVTDADFGRAYLRDAWAARFLERMFATYTVLFIGYSHGDVVMSYLGRSLRSDCARFVLTPEPDTSQWSRLGIRPVGYPVSGGSHVALVDGIGGWASIASMGLLDHRERVAELVSGAPSQIPEEMSYLESVVAGSDTVRFFAEFARGPEWLSWVSAQPEFTRLFDPRAEPTLCTAKLAHWFARNYVIYEDLTETALETLQKAGGHIGKSLWYAVGESLNAWREQRPAWLGPWLVLLAQHHPPDATSGWLDRALLASRWDDHGHEALLLFCCLTEPRAALRPGFGTGTELDIHLRGDDYFLRRSWEKVFTPHLAEAAHDVLVIVDRNLRHAYRLLSISPTARPGWDPLSFRRSAIEPHDQDAMRTSIGILIDAARDCLEVLLDDDDPLGRSYLDAWASSSVPLLRRLALHGWGHRADVHATAKLSWLSETGWLFDHQLRHEVFRLLASALPEASDDIADALVRDAVAGPGGDDEHSAYETFSVLAWIARHAPGLESAREAMQKVRAQHPAFHERVHPDLVAWFEVGALAYKPPMTVDELSELIGDDTEAAITELRKYEDKTSPFEGPTWHDATKILAQTVSAFPEDGLHVLYATGADHPDLVRAVIQGWSSATVDDDAAARFAERLMAVDLSALGGDVARMIATIRPSEKTGTEWHRLPEARHLANAAWSAIAAEPLWDRDEDGWPSRAINHPAGHLAEFWVHAVSADWRATGDAWQGLPPELRDQLELLLSGDDERTGFAEVILASQLHFFFSADRAWCKRRVLPLLDWADPERARRAWEGFLVWGRWNDQLLHAGLLDHYRATVRHIAEFSDELRWQLGYHLASIAVQSEIDPVGSGWVEDFTAAVDTAVRTEWIDRVAWLLGELPTEAVEHQWRRWMAGYWKKRLESVPVRLTAEEASAMAAWVVYLRDSFTEGADLAKARRAGLIQHSSLLHDLSDDQVARTPGAVAELVVHLLSGTDRPFYECDDLEGVVRALRAQPTPPDVSAICEQAVRLGCPDAACW